MVKGCDAFDDNVDITGVARVGDGIVLCLHRFVLQGKARLVCMPSAPLCLAPAGTGRGL